MPVRILIADDHKIMREGLRSLLAGEPEFQVVEEAENGRAAVESAGRLAPEVVIMDIAMPDLNGIEATRQILTCRPEARVIGLSMHSDRRFVSEMLKVGASGYLLKDCAAEELATAIRAVARGQTYLCPGVAGTVVNDYVRRLSLETLPQAATLSDREREVVQLLAEGRNTREVAERLHVSVKTVETHRQHIMKKLGMKSLAELTKYAIREGLTSLER